jgi:hypothetical protein
LSNHDLIQEYAELYRDTLKDEVLFARKILGFHPYSYQEAFLRDRSRLIAACCGRQVGKTTLAAIKALHFALANPITQVLIVSKGLRQSIILFDKILTFTDQATACRLLLTEKSRTRLKFANGSTILALPCGRDGSTLRGFTSDMSILDECNFIPRIVIDSVIRPTTIARPNARIVMLSTPWTKDHPFYEALTKSELGFSTYTWPTSINPQVPKERLDLDRKTVGEYDFNREYNAQFIDDQFSYFPSKLVLACTDDYPLNPDPKPNEIPKGEYHIGIDFGFHVDHSAIAIVQEQPDHNLRLIYLREFQLGTTYPAVIGSIRMLNAEYKFRSGYLDQTGVGEAPYQEIRQFAPTIKGITFSTRSKQDILGNLKLKMEHQTVTIPRDETRLLTQLTQQQAEPTIQGALTFSHPPGTHDDLAWAFALSVYAYRGPTDWMGTVIGIPHRE